MQANQPLDIAHRIVEGQPEPPENDGHHFRPAVFVAVESPAGFGMVALGEGLRNVMQNGHPAQPQVVRHLCHVVEHLEGVVKIVFVPPAFHFFHAPHGLQFRQNEREQAKLRQLVEAPGGFVGANDFVELFGNALFGNDAEAVCLGKNGPFGSFIDPEAGQLSKKTHRPQHSKGVVGEGHIGLKRGSDQAVVEVADAVKRVDQASEFLRLQGQRQGVDCKIAAKLVVVEGAVFYEGFAAAALVAFAPGPDKFHDKIAGPHHGRPEVGIHRHLLAVDSGCKGLCQLDTVAFHHDVNVLARPAQEIIPHKPSDRVGTEAHVLAQAGKRRKQGKLQGFRKVHG